MYSARATGRHTHRNSENELWNSKWIQKLKYVRLFFFQCHNNILSFHMLSCNVTVELLPFGSIVYVSSLILKFVLIFFQFIFLWVYGAILLWTTNKISQFLHNLTFLPKDRSYFFCTTGRIKYQIFWVFQVSNKEKKNTVWPVVFKKTWFYCL